MLRYNLIKFLMLSTPKLVIWNQRSLPGVFKIWSMAHCVTFIKLIIFLGLWTILEKYLYNLIFRNRIHIKSKFCSIVSIRFIIVDTIMEISGYDAPQKNGNHSEITWNCLFLYPKSCKINSMCIMNYFHILKQSN